MRADQQSTYVVIATGETVIWLPSRSYVYHASVDGLRAVCNRAILVRENGSGIADDRSNSVLTCYKCAERVRRVKTASSSPIDVEAAIKRHAARELGIPVQDLGRRFT